MTRHPKAVTDEHLNVLRSLIQRYDQILTARLLGRTQLAAVAAQRSAVQWAIDEIGDRP